MAMFDLRPRCEAQGKVSLSKSPTTASAVTTVSKMFQCWSSVLPLRRSELLGFSLSLSLSLHGGDISDGSDVGRNGRSGRYRRVCQGQGCQPERGTLETLGRDTVTSSLAGDFACSLLVAGTKEFPLLCGAHPGQPSAIPSEGPVLRKGTDKHQTPAETNRPSRPLCTHA